MLVQLLLMVLTVFPMAIMDMEDMVTWAMGSSSMENSASMGNSRVESLESMVCSESGSNSIHLCIYNHDL